MENFIVSARKYRPSEFASVVGQGSITVTLKNAISNKRLAHAYLFCGPRGVGKTTCARIFAKTINCQNITEDYEPCGECESCRSFGESRSYNIHELDAASNNSVEDIRALIDQVRIPPQLGKYSVYIIDEVHMLSTAAFNAFLKTLEEPPSHAIFVLATTEKHKILPTILSRCQIFDFNRMGVEDTVHHLQYVADKEGIAYEIDALNVIAQKADGAMRDALSIFDQVSSFSGRNITYKSTIENLNVLDYDFYFRLVDAFLGSKIPESLLIFHEILSKGFDAHHFVTGLSSHFRDLLVCTDSSTVQLLEVGANIREKYKEQAHNCKPDFLFNALKISNKCDTQYKSSNNQRLLVELMLLRLCNIVLDEEKKLELERKAQNKQEQVTTNQVVNSNVVVEEVKPKTSSTYSIKSALGNIRPLGTQKEEENNSPVRLETPQITTTKAFSQEELTRFWNLYIQELTPRQAAIVNRPFTLTENFVIEFVLDSKTSEETFKKEIQEGLISYLRKNLENQQIEIRTLINEANVVKKALSIDERFEILKEKKPEIELLKDKFNLTF